MPSLSTISLVLCLAVSHVSTQIWFPDQLPHGTAARFNNHQHGTERRQVLVKDVRQPDAGAQRSGRNGFVTQQNGLRKTQPQNRQNALRRNDGQRLEQNLEWNRQTGQWVAPRFGNNGQWNQQQTRNNNNNNNNNNNGERNRTPILAKRINANPLPQRIDVNPTLQQQRPVKSRTTPVSVTTTPVPDEDQEFDDYWLEDDLKDQQETEPAVEAAAASAAAVNEIEVAVKETGPSRCVWAIISCCKPTAVTSQIRYSCFEALGCHGAFWDVNPCGKQMMAAALQATANFYKVPKDDD